MVGSFFLSVKSVVSSSRTSVAFWSSLISNWPNSLSEKVRMLVTTGSIFGAGGGRHVRGACFGSALFRVGGFPTSSLLRREADRCLQAGN